MAYNLGSGGVGREPQLRRVIAAIKPDLAVFSEVRTASVLRTIAEVVGDHCILAPQRLGRTRVALVSKWPVVSWAAHGPAWSREKFLEGTVSPGHGPAVTVHAVHLVAQPLWPFELWRRSEVRYLTRRLALQPERRQVVAGDFNTVVRGDAYRPASAPWVRIQELLQGGTRPRWALAELVGAGFVDCFRHCQPSGDGFTVPASEPGARIDYIFVSPELKSQVRAAGTVESSDAEQASDHLPVWADIEWSSEHAKTAG